MKKKGDPLELNQLRTPLAEFRKNYNENIPSGFPKATFSLLKKFKSAHPSLFKTNEDWSVDLHRKKLMDWLESSVPHSA